MTSPDRLKSLAGCGDITSLKSAVEDICTEFGKVTRIDVLTIAEARKRRALCFLRLESPEQERQLKKFGAILAIRVCICEAAHIQSYLTGGY